MTKSILLDDIDLIDSRVGIIRSIWKCIGEGLKVGDQFFRGTSAFRSIGGTLCDLGHESGALDLTLISLAGSEIIPGRGRSARGLDLHGV